MKKYLDVNGVTSLYKIIMGKVDDKLDEKLQLLLTPSTRPLTFEVLENGTFSFITNGTPTGSVSYSLDSGTTWTALSAGSSTPTIPAGSKVLWKGDYKGAGSFKYGKFSSTGKFNVSGNVISLMYGDDFKDKTDLTGSNYCFIGLFKGCSKLMDVSDLILPATTLASNCYNNMFSGCTSLTTAPELPATTLASSCYNNMFSDCTSLKTAPELPVTTLASSCYSNMFSGCTSLTTAPELPATELADSCYSSMFNGCTSLTTAPALPATTIAPSCYNSMFSNCTSLTSAPELPVTTLAKGCYSHMFHNCTSLTTAPELPATTLALSCYQYMFDGCTSLTTAPELPATTLASNCYWNMFSGCTSLTTAPELPATELADSCYQDMFYNCTSLTTAPVLPATTLAKYCYGTMFNGCPKLNYIKALFTTTPGSSYTNNWVSGVASTGTFVKNAAATWNVTGTNGIPTGWNVGYDFDGLTFTALENTTFSFSKDGLSYSLDNRSTWTTLRAGKPTPTVAAGSKIFWKGNYKGTSDLDYGNFSSTGKFNVSGNIMSLMYGDDFRDKTDLTGSDYCFYGLFKGCLNLIDASKFILPATTLAPYCYSSMFSGCTSLTTAPELPATNLAEYCYQYMFQGCSSLTIAPELPATNLVNYCYQYMFDGCTSLTTAPALPATTLAQSCYRSMFNGCKSLTTAPALPATTLATYCYEYMFRGCTSLTTAPALPATTLAQSCYSGMFTGCSSLTTAPELPATNLAEYCYQYMFQGCSSLTIAPELPATNLVNYCYQYMFDGCTSLTTAPKTLPATRSPSYCYQYMFQRCTSLKTAPELPATTIYSSCYNSMFQGCTSLTTAPKILPAITLANSCYSSMFEGCSSLTTAPVLPATRLADYCYQDMFNRCSKLNYIKALFITDPVAGGHNYTSNWVNGVSSTGTFVKNADATWEVTGASGVPAGWNVKYSPDMSEQYLTFTALENGTFSFSNTGTPTGSVSYSLDNGTSWTTLSAGSSTPAVTTGSKVLWKGNYKGTSGSDFGNFSSTGKFNVSGNVMSLTYGDDFKDKTDLTGSDYCFLGLFSDCSNLIDASNLILPATTLAKSCYYNMFYKCTSLTLAPELPATTLADGCYLYMFSSCTSLTTAPELPATNLANVCYGAMFNNCPNLNYIKAMFITDPSTGSYTNNWVTGVSSTGTFVKNVNATWDVTGTKGIPTGWTVETAVPPFTGLAFEALEDGTFSFSKDGLGYSLDNGTSWTTLSAGSSTPTITKGSKVLWKGDYKGTGSSNYGRFSSTGKFNVSGNIMSLTYGDDFEDKIDLTGSNYCFNKLFYGCSNLIDASNLILPATTLAKSCYSGMFQGCTSLTTAPELPATTLADDCYNSMFKECTSLTLAPELPATTLAKSCYYNMFYKCTSLTLAPELPATTLVRYCYAYMFLSCSKLNYIKAMFTTVPSSTYTSNWVKGVSSTGTFVKNADATWNVAGNNGVPTGWKAMHDPISRYLTFEVAEDGTFSFSKDGLSYSLDNGTTWVALSAGSSTPTVTAGSKVLWKGNYKAISDGDFGQFSSTGEFDVSGNVMSLTYGDDFKDKTDLAGSDYCFYGLFYGCSKLVYASDIALPATNLVSYCYSHMFSDCTSLITAPELPAITLANSCYAYMFQGCTSLTVAPELPAITLANSCYAYMFQGCSFLIVAPGLPATTLVTNCYCGMFYGCSKLNYIKALFTTTPGSSYTDSWVSGVSSTGTFVKNAAATWDVTGINGVPTGWTVETATA